MDTDEEELRKILWQIEIIIHFLNNTEKYWYQETNTKKKKSIQ